MVATLSVGDMECIWRFYSLLLFMTPAAYGTLTVKPENRVAVIGDKFTLRCQTDTTYNLRWNGCSAGSPKEENMIIHNGYNSSLYASRFSRLHPVVDGEYSLEITAMREAAMTYECLEPGTLERSSAVVTILESHPICHMTYGSDFAESACYINSWGDWIPTWEWVACNGTNVTADISRFISPNNKVTSKIMLRQNSYSSGFCLNLTAGFKEDGRPNIADAENIPPYNHTISFNRSSDMRNFVEEDSRNAIAYVVIPIVLLIVVAVVMGCRYRAKLNCCRRVPVHNSSASPLMAHNGLEESASPQHGAK